MTRRMARVLFVSIRSSSFRAVLRADSLRPIEDGLRARGLPRGGKSTEVIKFLLSLTEFRFPQTLLYMLLQAPRTLPPPGFAVPDFDHLASTWSAQRTRDASFPSTLTIGPTTISLGHHDLEAEDDRFSSDFEDHEFGWDNEQGVHDVEIGRIRVERKPVSNGEYRAFLEGKGESEKTTIPGSWIEVDGEWKVRFLLPMKLDLVSSR